MLLAIDAGNTRIKWAVFEGDNLIVSDSCLKEKFNFSLQKIIKKYPEIQDAILSSVSNFTESDLGFIKSSIKVTVVDRKSPLPFINLYESPETLGLDRIVLSAAAVLKYPNTNRLVIDAGTCITYDFVDEKNRYQGGAISPGIQMRYKAMHEFTANLPALEISDFNGCIGKNTKDSMHSGVINGVVGEINHMINSIGVDSENFTIILTGGDAVFLAKRLKSTIFAHSNFLLEGLNQYFYFLRKHA